MRLEDAQKIILRPLMTERTFDQIARENKLCFMVHDKASKTQIASAVEALYEVKVRTVNTLRCIEGRRHSCASIPRTRRPSWQRNWDWCSR